MTTEQAIEIMKQSTNVKEWNKNREKVKDSCTNKEWQDIYWKIDCQGLIVEVLGKN